MSSQAQSRFPLFVCVVSPASRLCPLVRRTQVAQLLSRFGGEPLDAVVAAPAAEEVKEAASGVPAAPSDAEWARLGSQGREMDLKRVMERLRLEDAAVLNVYLAGSRLWGYAGLRACVVHVTRVCADPQRRRATGILSLS
jgi:hypothetical protein